LGSDKLETMEIYALVWAHPLGFARPAIAWHVRSLFGTEKRCKPHLNRSTNTDAIFS